MSLPVGNPKYELSTIVSPGSPVSDSPECTNSEDANADPCEQPESSASKVDNTPDSEERPHVTGRTVQPGSMRDARVGDDINDAVVLSEVRGSLSTISNGVEELATTVRDFFGISDSESDSSTDYDRDSNGRRGQLNWGKLRSHAKRRRRLRLQRKSGQANVAKDESEDDWGESGKHARIIPDVRECNFEHFQSRPAGDSNEFYCVDILIAGDELDREMREFSDAVANLKSGEIDSWKPGHASDRTGKSDSQNNVKKWIRRIRINSQAVMDVLRFLFPGVQPSFPRRPTVFRRPFQLLVSLHDEFKEKLAEIKGIVSDGPEEGAHPEVPTLNIAQTDEWNGLIKKLGDNKNAIAELTCFADFMETRIMPDARRYRDLSSPPPKTIRQEDLWYLFKPGDLIYVSRDTSGRDHFRSRPFSQSILRIIQTALGDRIPAPIGESNERPWSIFGHFIEYDGNSYAPVHVNLGAPFTRWDGERKITELPFYPISYLEDDQLITQAQSDGETYISLIERRSGFYSGWTQTVDPLGVQITELSPENRVVSPEHIESEVLVDFQETFNAVPAWRPKFYPITAPVEGIANSHHGNLVPDESDLPIIEWDQTGRTKLVQIDLDLEYDPTEVIEAKRFLDQDPLGQFRKETRRAPNGEFRALLPRRFFGYAVLERRFVQLSTRFVRSAELEANDKAFENLEINRIYKQLILALVKSHFDKIETEKRTSVEIESQDLIRGKGKGVVILLHGVPGVGKTATAEAVALKWKRPLFPITCGDLGYTADMLEKSLNEIFRLAHHWGCILLLDEADVFITQRERHDLKRNALVSAFLRVLEYYNGIMFLTTNRAGVLDEAIKSRVHLNLYYDHLSEEQTVAIFKQHIQRLRNIEKQRNPDQNEQIMVLHKEIIQFARDHYNQRGSSHGPGSNFGRWNGRQIRNAFLIASSLAHYDSEDEGDEEDKDDLAEHGRKKQKQLGRSQFEIVAKTTLMYDQYRQSVHSGKSDDHVAFDREERAMLSQPRSPTPDRLKKPSMGFN